MSDNKRTVPWTMEEDEILIDFVKKHECLYNIKCKDFRKPQIKLNLWREIGNRFNDKTDIECSKRWAYVRDYYVRRKEKPSSGTPGEASKKRAAQMSFLDKYCSLKRSSTTNIQGTSASDTLDLDEDVNEEFDERSTQNPIKEEFDFQSEILFKETDNIEYYQEIPNERSTPLKRPRQFSNSKECVEKSSIEEEEDETDIFFKCMAKIVKKLPERERVLMRLQIGTLVGNAELRCLDQLNCNNSANSS